MRRWDRYLSWIPVANSVMVAYPDQLRGADYVTPPPENGWFPPVPELNPAPHCPEG